MKTLWDQCKSNIICTRDPGNVLLLFQLYDLDRALNHFYFALQENSVMALANIAHHRSFMWRGWI